jgi:hypothetical protein
MNCKLVTPVWKTKRLRGREIGRLSVLLCFVVWLLNIATCKYLFKYNNKIENTEVYTPSQK